MFSFVNQSYLEIYGENHPSSVNTLINLAAIHKDMREFEQAIPLFEKAIEARKVMEGEGSLNYGMALAMASGCYREIEKYDVADKYIKEAFLVVVTLHGEDSVGAAVILNSMGMLYKKQNKFERAVDAYERALKIREEHLGLQHPDTIACRHNIAEVYISWANPDKAREYIEKNLEVMQKLNEEEKKIAEENLEKGQTNFL